MKKSSQSCKIKAPIALRGRPCLLTLKRKLKLLKGIERGLPLKQAAALAGISYDTFNRWKKRGENPYAPKEFHDFCKAVERAQAVAMRRLLATVRKAGSTDWKAAVWILERRFPKDFGKEEQVTKISSAAVLPSSKWTDHPVTHEIKKRERMVELLQMLQDKVNYVQRQKAEEAECRIVRKMVRA